MRYDFSYIRLAKIFKNLIIPRVGKFVGKQAISYSHGGVINWYNFFGGQSGNIKILNAHVS